MLASSANRSIMGTIEKRNGKTDMQIKRITTGQYELTANGNTYHARAVNHYGHGREWLLLLVVYKDGYSGYTDFEPLDVYPTLTSIKRELQA